MRTLRGNLPDFYDTRKFHFDVVVTESGISRPEWVGFDCLLVANEFLVTLASPLKTREMGRPRFFIQYDVPAIA